jgi:hypothetical protein
LHPSLHLLRRGRMLRTRLLCVYAAGALYQSGLDGIQASAPAGRKGALTCPPATVITSGLPARLRDRERNAPFVVMRAEPETDARATPPLARETTNRSALQPSAAAPVPRSPARQAKKPAPQAAAEAPKPQESPCLPGYDSSGAQTRSWLDQAIQGTGRATRGCEPNNLAPSASTVFCFAFGIAA